MIYPFEELSKTRQAGEKQTQLLEKVLATPPKWIVPTEAITERLGGQLERATERIEKAAQGIPSEVRLSGEVAGFTSLRAMMVYTLAVGLTTGAATGAALYYRSQAEVSEKVQQEAANGRAFYEWVAQKYPKVVEVYRRE